MFWFSGSQKAEAASESPPPPPFWWTQTSLFTGPLVEAYEQLDTWCFGSDEFERTVAKTLLVILSINVVLIVYVWRRHGERIADQFLNVGESNQRPRGKWSLGEGSRLLAIVQRCDDTHLLPARRTRSTVPSGPAVTRRANYIVVRAREQFVSVAHR